jgi:hypothetical protein
MVEAVVLAQELRFAMEILVLLCCRTSDSQSRGGLSCLGIAPVGAPRTPWGVTSPSFFRYIVVPSFCKSWCLFFRVVGYGYAVIEHLFDLSMHEAHSVAILHKTIQKRASIMHLHRHQDPR